MTDGEQWSPIPGFPGYEASDHGRVRTWKRRGTELSTPRLLNVTICKRTGYPRTSMRAESGRRQRVNIHEAVLFAFRGPRPQGCVARHFPDATKTNVALSNLRWGTCKENGEDTVFHGTSAKGAINGSSKLTEAQAKEIIALTGLAPTKVLMGWFGLSKPQVDSIIAGRAWGHLPRPTIPRGNKFGRGVFHSRARLSEADVYAIRESGDRIVDIARRYELDQSTVSNIRSRRIWRSLPERSE